MPLHLAIGLERQLEGIRAFGTDGEQALIYEFCREFCFSHHLTCFIHVKQNIKDKCAECNLPSDLSQQIIDDIFGKQVDVLPSKHHAGAVSAKTTISNDCLC